MNNNSVKSHSARIIRKLYLINKCLVTIKEIVSNKLEGYYTLKDIEIEYELRIYNPKVIGTDLNYFNSMKELDQFCYDKYKELGYKKYFIKTNKNEYKHSKENL